MREAMQRPDVLSIISPTTPMWVVRCGDRILDGGEPTEEDIWCEPLVLWLVLRDRHGEQEWYDPSEGVPNPRQKVSGAYLEDGYLTYCEEDPCFLGYSPKGAVSLSREPSDDDPVNWYNKIKQAQSLWRKFCGDEDRRAK